MNSTQRIWPLETRGIASKLAALLPMFLLALVAAAQSISTTTVQGTVYLANGQTASGTVVVSWPAFTTAAGQSVAADSLTLPLPGDGFLSVNLAPNQGATPAGLFYTAVFYLSDGSTTTQYWVVPAAAQASLAQVQSQVMPAAQAVQAVSKSYVDGVVAQLEGSLLTASGGNLTGPLYLNADPTQPLQAADKHYVDASAAQSLPLAGGASTGQITALQLGAAYQVDQFPGADFGAKLQSCLAMLNPAYGGTCDARNFTGSMAMASNLTISTPNSTILLPCATISTASQILVTAGTRNVSLRGCALRGGSAASGSQGGTAFLYSGSAAFLQIGDSTYSADTSGFHLENALLNTTASTSPSAQSLIAYRTQELNLENLYFLGNANQTALTLDGTGNYTGGSFYAMQFAGFQTAVNAIGHQQANPATTDWLNASTFVRIHIDCPTASGNPIAGTTGINLLQGDGNTLTGGDVEGCSTALHLGPNAQNNTIVGLRNENSTSQVVADSGSSYNNWITGGTLFTGQLIDNGTRNSFLDTFHRAFNGLNGDWYGSQKDATLTNHIRLGIGAGNERGLMNEVQTDYGYRWLEGYTDATAGEQFFQIQDLFNNVNRLSIGQYNNGQASTNNQTVLNSAGTGAIVLNGSSNAGSGGTIFGSGGATPAAVATINNAGNAQFNGTLLVGGTSQSTGTMTVRNNADAEVDYYLWPGLTSSQKGSFTYKDWNGNSQWYMLKDSSNNWALNSATGGLDSLKAYQSTNSGDTYINASNSSGVVRVNYESGAGSQFKVYGGSSSSLYASFTGAAAIQFPGLAAASGHNCVQIDNSGYLTNTGSACGTGTGGSGTVSTATSGQIATYTASGSTIGGISQVPLAAGGTGASTAAAALANLGAQPAIPGLTSDGSNGIQVSANGSFAGSLTSKFSDGIAKVSVSSGTDVGIAISSAFSSMTAPTGSNPHAQVDLNPLGSAVFTVASTIHIPAWGRLDCHGAILNVISTAALTANVAIQVGSSTNNGPDQQGTLRNCIVEYNGAIANGYVANSVLAMYFGGDPNGVISPTSAWGSQFVVENSHFYGFNAVLQGGNNWFADTFLNNFYINNYNVIADTVCGSNSGELLAVIGGQASNSAANEAVLNCNHEWSFNSARLDYGNSLGLYGAQAAATISGTGIDVVLQGSHLEHWSGPFVSGTYSYMPARVTVSGGEMALTAKGAQQTITGYSLTGNVATLLTAGATPPYLVAGQWVQISGMVSAAAYLNGFYPVQSVASNGAQFTVNLTHGNDAGVASGLTGLALEGAASITSCQITAASGSSAYATFTAANAYVAGERIGLAGLTTSGSSCGLLLNSQNVTVSSTGLSSSSFQADVSSLCAASCANVSPTTETTATASVYQDHGLVELHGASNVVSLLGLEVYPQHTFGNCVYSGYDSAPLTAVLNTRIYGYIAPSDCLQGQIFSTGNIQLNTGLTASGTNNPVMSKSSATTSQGIPGKFYCPSLAAGQLCSNYTGIDGSGDQDAIQDDLYFAGVNNAANYWGRKLNGASGYSLTGDHSGNIVAPVSFSTAKLFGTGTATFTAGAAAGTSPGTPACAASHTCDSFSGTISFTTGTATTNAILLTVTPGVTRTNQPNCHLQAWVTSTGVPLAVYPTYTTSTIIFNTGGTAPAATTAYTLSYSGCGGS